MGSQSMGPQDFRRFLADVGLGALGGMISGDTGEYRETVAAHSIRTAIVSQSFHARMAHMSTQR